MDTDGTRLNKFLASCGIGSRRGCDEMIQHGRIEVNGKVCINPGTRVTPADHVRVDGRRVMAKAATVLAFHKPRGFVCSKDDELGRETIYQFIPPAMHHLHHVGRLDLDSEGLLILTNDGELTQQLMHPSKSMEKEYLVTSNQAFENHHLDQFLIGIYTPEGKLKAKAIERLSARRLRVVLEHGAKRQIRVMFEALGYQVTKLMRVRIGSLGLGDLEPGRWQQLESHEIALLLKNPKPLKPDGNKPVKPKAEKKAAKKAAPEKPRPAAKKFSKPKPANAKFTDEPPASKRGAARHSAKKQARGSITLRAGKKRRH